MKLKPKYRDMYCVMVYDRRFNTYDQAYCNSREEAIRMAKEALPFTPTGYVIYFKIRSHFFRQPKGPPRAWQEIIGDVEFYPDEGR
jgi:hypothetical protein